MALIAINLKAYEEGWADAGLAIQRAVEACSGPDAQFALCPGAQDIGLFASARTPGAAHALWAQDADPVPPGSFTGHLPLEALKSAGAAGTLINHAERQRPLLEIEFLVKLARKLGVVSCVCSADEKSTRSLARLRPDYLAIEPPQLIGGEVSVTTADPEIVVASVRAVREVAPGTKVLCGAGVRSGADVEKALELGTWGVLLASGVVKAEDPAAAIRDLVSRL